MTVQTIRIIQSIERITPTIKDVSLTVTAALLTKKIDLTVANDAGVTVLEAIQRKIVDLKADDAQAAKSLQGLIDKNEA